MGGGATTSAEEEEEESGNKHIKNNDDAQIQPCMLPDLVRHQGAQTPLASASQLTPTSEKRSQLIFAASANNSPKTSSASFKAKRAQHYNEFKMLQAFRQKQAAE